MPRLPALALLSLLALLSGCDKLGIQTPADVAAGKEAEARAIGSACRQAGRAIEDCYTLNPKAGKAAVFAGWREMDEYMRENKLEVVQPTVPRPAPGASAPAKSATADGEDAAAEGTSAGKAGKAQARDDGQADIKADTKAEADETPAHGPRGRHTG